MLYDCLIVGGGIAGLQAAIQLGRYRRRVLVIDAGDGRSALCHEYHNILGYPHGVSGQYLRETGRKQAEQYGVDFVLAKALSAEKEDGNFSITVNGGKKYRGKRLLLATGVTDRLPPFPEIYPCLGKSVYICPDCDGYEVIDKRVLVLGSGNAGAKMALALTYWTKEIIYINHDDRRISSGNQDKLAKAGIVCYGEPVVQVLAEGPSFQGVILHNGETINANHAFLAFGSNQANTLLGKQLGVERLENKHIIVDPRTKMTSVKNVWAAGDACVHSEQVTLAMGDGLQAAVWIHKSLFE